MAVLCIAAATGGGKSARALDRAAIFRSAHEHARRELTWGGRKWTYRKAFSVSLRAVYRAEKEAAEERAYQATLPPIPLDVQQRVRELHAAAWGCRITSAGNLEYDRLSAQARDLIDAARAPVSERVHTPEMGNPEAENFVFADAYGRDSTAQTGLFA